MVSRWRFFVVAVVASLFAFAGAAQAVPTFLTPADLSPAGQHGFEPQVKVDNSGNVHAVWTKSDGAVLRIQYSTRTASGSWSAPINISPAGQAASQPQLDVHQSTGDLLVVWTRFDGVNQRIQAVFKPSGGSFGAVATVSDPGFDANEPQIDFDSSGKAIAVWSRFDGSFLRVQASVRSAGAGGTFANEVTLSQGGQDAFDAQIDAGPNADANGVVVWTRSDGTNLRVQAARRRDVTGFLRPKSAGVTLLTLAPAFNQCAPGTGNRQHGPPLAFESCAPPVRSSAVLTVGSPDANGFGANSTASVKFRAVNGNAATEANEADLALITQVEDVRNHPAGTDYVGPLGIRLNLQITDNRNADEQPEAGTTQSFPLEWPIQCLATADATRGSSCTQTATVNSLIPGAMLESKRTIWEFGQLTLRDAGPNGTGYASCPPTCGDGDETTFMRQAIFVP